MAFGAAPPRSAEPEGEESVLSLPSLVKPPPYTSFRLFRLGYRQWFGVVIPDSGLPVLGVDIEEERNLDLLASNAARKPLFGGVLPFNSVQFIYELKF